MSIIIRMQNLPWAADSVDIRRFFSGLCIPDGGVHIVGGEVGDVFIAFATDEDARLAMAKDGGKIHEMQVKLLLSSRTEMMKVIEKARQQNLVMQNQAVVPPVPASTTAPPVQSSSRSTTSDPKRARSPSPHHRRGRDRSPARDRYRSPDSRRGGDRKRDRSRSPSRRGGNRDTDRRGDRFKREERRSHDEDSRYRGDDRRSSRDSPQDTKKYSDSNNQNNNNRSSVSQNDAFRDTSSRGFYETAPNNNTTNNYVSQPPITKDLPPAFLNAPIAEKTPPLQSMVDTSVLDRLKIHLSQIATNTASSFPQQQQPASYTSLPFEVKMEPFDVKVEPFSVPSSTDTGVGKDRLSRFQPGYVAPVETPYFTAQNNSLNLPASGMQAAPSYIDRGPEPQEFRSASREAWSNEVHQHQENRNWPDNSHASVSQPNAKNVDYIRAVPMDLDPPEPLVQNSFVIENLPPVQQNLHVFNRNETIPRHNDPRMAIPSRVGPPPMQNPWQPPLSLAVEIRGLPPDARVGDVMSLFPNIHIPPVNICMVSNNHGAEKALVRFANASDLKFSLNGQPRYIHNNRCNIVECSEEVFEATVSVQNSFKAPPKAKPRDEDLCVQLRGLPFSCSKEDLMRFFEGLRVADLFLGMAPDGRSSGIGYVVLGTPQDFRSALTLNGKMIGHRYITISVSSKEMMANARGEDYPVHSERIQNPVSQAYVEPHSPRRSKGPLLDAMPDQRKPTGSHASPNRPTSYCISLKNLPNNVSNRVIVDIFQTLDVMIQAIHILLKPDKTPSGDAFVEVTTQREADIGLSANGKNVFGNRITLKQISYKEMTDILEGPVPQPLVPPPVPGPLLRTPKIVETPPIADGERPRRPLLPQGPVEDDPFRAPVEHPRNDRLHSDYNKDDRARMDFNRNERNRIESPRGDRPHMGDDRPHMDDVRGDRPHMDFARGNRPHMDDARDDRLYMDDPRGDRLHMDDPRGNRHHMDNPRDDGLLMDDPRGDRPRTDLPRDRPRMDFPRDKPRMDFPRGERPRMDFPRDRPRMDFPRDRPRMDFPRDRPRMDFPRDRLRMDFPRDRPRMDFPRDRPRMDFPRGERPRMDFARGERPRMDRPMRPPFGRMRPPFPIRALPPPDRERSPNDFGAPGCVVAIDNLHFRAGLEELLDFFHEYSLTKDSIIRKFNQRGQATGEARVAFESPSAAQKVIHELHMKPIMGRPLTLEIL